MYLPAPFAVSALFVCALHFIRICQQYGKADYWSVIRKKGPAVNPPGLIF
jgi:hypothetical protein